MNKHSNPGWAVEERGKRKGVETQSATLKAVHQTGQQTPMLKGSSSRRQRCRPQKVHAINSWDHDGTVLDDWNSPGSPRQTTDRQTTRILAESTHAPPTARVRSGVRTCRFMSALFRHARFDEIGEAAALLNPDNIFGRSGALLVDAKLLHHQNSLGCSAVLCTLIPACTMATSVTSKLATLSSRTSPPESPVCVIRARIVLTKRNAGPAACYHCRFVALLISRWPQRFDST